MPLLLFFVPATPPLYVCSLRLLWLTLLILLESDDDPLNPDLGWARTLGGEFFHFHLVLVLVLNDNFNNLVLYALYNQVEAQEKFGFHC
jgi:hypothetical protein